MAKTINFSTDIPASHKLRITLPLDIPAGPADIVLVVSSAARPETLTLGEFADSEFFGAWRDRADITDSVDFARDVRVEGWKRSA